MKKTSTKNKPTNILEEIKKRKLQSLQRSIAFAERNEKVVHNSAEYTKSMVLTPQEEIQPFIYLMNLYHQMKDDYKGGGALYHIKEPSNRQISFWKRVLTCVEESGVEPKDYLTAQFKFFHHAFGKTPEAKQLTTPGAVLRAKAFAESTNKPKYKIISNGIETKKDFALTMKLADEQMRNICKAQNLTREEVYRKFVLTGLISFPKEYLKHDPEYHTLVG